MGLVGCLVWVNSRTKKRCRSLLCRMRVVVKAAAGNGGKQRFRFQYDPSSYALNFDDGGDCRNLGLGFGGRAEPIHSKKTATTWVFVLWVESH
ncbi:hypothetical protein RJ639_030062 [Escallonia herrerae]|uniref:Uncharacterized protein n=1 Tax=Escallonia herrerae TaxID=1293975 RepID=A0AA89BD82_9ASTE|nr:hypothetical protein RJ639_030062 [Escallonia herrerae]